jgi:KDO2-lipid IV(A) lauroyltransferase
MYRPNDNPVIDRTIEKGRRRHYGIQAFDKKRLKDMFAFIQDGGQVWYAVDQDFGNRCDVFAPFFGVQAGCISAPSWIARESGATVMVVSQFRHPNGQYEITFSPILENFGQDDQADAIVWNAYLEEAVRKHPDQYLWLHKRFKTRQEGLDNVYR